MPSFTTMADYNDLEAKIEAAFQKVLQDDSTVATDNIFTGQDNDPELLPRVVVHAQQGGEVARGCNIYKVSVELLVESVGYTDNDETNPVPAHRALVSAVRSGALQATIPTLLNAAAAALGFELTILDVLDPAPGHTVTEGTRFSDAMSLQLVAAGANI